jgi:transcriptional regulator with XRE-family HTH domain
MDVKALRQGLGLTQDVFAARVGVSALTVHHWETGTHQPKGQRLARLVSMAQRLREGQQADLAQSTKERADALALAAVDAGAPMALIPDNRPTLTLGQAVRRMGLMDDGHGRRSDRTLRNAIKSGALKAARVPGNYRRAIKEWCFYEHDFETWLRTHYQAHRDPRRSST